MSRSYEFEYGASKQAPWYGTDANPAAFDGGSMMHAYNDNDRIDAGNVTTASNVGGKYDQARDGAVYS